MEVSAPNDAESGDGLFTLSPLLLPLGRDAPSKGACKTVLDLTLSIWVLGALITQLILEYTLPMLAGPPRHALPGPKRHLQMVVVIVLCGSGIFHGLYVSQQPLPLLPTV